MQLRRRSSRAPEKMRATFLTLCTSVVLVGCTPAENDTGGSGGAGPGASGGAPASSGGAVGSSGGAPGSSGGAVGSGGAPASSGGMTGSSGGSTGSSGGAPGSSGGASGTGGAGTGGAASGGRGGSSTGTGGRGTGGAAGGGTGTGGRATGGSGSGGAGGSTGKFSFFVTSMDAIKRLSGSTQGFGGDLRYGQATGLAGADKICTEIAESAMTGAGSKTWRAFLSTTKGGTNDGPVHAIDRIGEGPWYDRMGRTLALTKAALNMTRPQGADAAIVNDFPNEFGIPNHNPDGTGQVDNHDFLTGTGTTGQLYNSDWKYTCHDWTSKVGSDGTPRCGHSWPRGVQSWQSVLNEAGCGAGINVVEMGGPNPNDPTVGSGGGYGGFYCFALTP